MSAVAIKGIAVWSTPDRLVVTFPEQMSTLNAPTVYGPSGQPIRRLLATLVDDILTAYRDATQTAPLTPHTPLVRHAHPTDPPTTTENQSTSPRVGDRVRVRREFRGNPANTVAVCFDVWDRGDGTTAISLVFPNGIYDVFWWGDEFFAFERLDHIPALASYRYSTLGRLQEDIRAGVFATAWLTPLP